MIVPCSPSSSPRSCGMSVSSAWDVGGDTSELVGLEDTEVELTSFVTTGSVWNAGGDAYDVCPRTTSLSMSISSVGSKPATGLE